MFKHYILTRFNLGLYTNNPYNIENPDKWMDKRIKLFEETALYSIKNQTVKKFKWIIAFDENTPTRYIKMIDYCDCVELCFEQPHFYLRNQEIAAEWIITSRLDNDDCYEPEFVEDIQSNFRFETEIIDIRYQRADYMIAKEHIRNRCNSPFLSLIEKWEPGICTAMGYNHTDMPDYFPGRKINKILATQVIHGDNIKNSF